MKEDDLKVVRQSSPLIKDPTNDPSNMRQSTLQLVLKSEARKPLLAVGKKEDDQPGSGRRTLMGKNYYSTADIAQANTNSDEVMAKLSNSVDRQSVAPCYTKPVDALRKSKVDQRRAKREEFRNRMK